MMNRSNSARLFADSASRPTRLILVEDTARWPLVSTTRPTETMVIAQSGDDYEAFGARTLRKLASLTASRRPVRSAFFAVGDKTEDEAAEGRRAIARAVASHIDEFGGGELILVSQPSSSADTRSALVALADGLLAELGSNDVSISIQFGVPPTPRSSGVRAASRAAASSGAPASTSHPPSGDSPSTHPPSGTRLRRVIP